MIKVTKEQFSKIAEAFLILKDKMPDESTFTLRFGQIADTPKELQFFMYLFVNENAVEVANDWIWAYATIQYDLSW